MPRPLPHYSHSSYRHSVLAITILIGTLAVPLSASGSDSDLYDVVDLEKLQRTFERLAADARPSVAAISTFRILKHPDGRELKIPHGVGSGFICAADGKIVTNHHVIEEADRIEALLFDGRSFEARLIQFDPRSDLAVIKIEAQNLRVAPLGQAEHARPGRWVFTVGNPFGLAGSNGGNTSVAFGTVTAIGQFLDIDPRNNDRYYGNLIQTDASVNPGNSGGPLFNIRGQVIGVATAMLSSSGVDEGVGFALPMSDRVRRIIALLSEGREVRYGYLGVKITTIDPQASSRLGIPYRRGAILTAIPKTAGYSPAAAAGLEPGDVITEIEGEPIRDSDQVVRMIGSMPVGSEVKVVYYRGKREMAATVVLTERAETVAARAKASGGALHTRSVAWRDLTLVEFEGQLGHAPRDAKPVVGLYVAECTPGSLLFRRGIRAGDLITKCDGVSLRSLQNLDECERAAGSAIRLELHTGKTIVLPN